MTAVIFGLLLYPKIQKRAQAELDQVVGRNRLPDLRDIDSLPYINAIIKETLRWKTAAPLGVPHRSSEDDVYDGKIIPAGTVVIGNAWSGSCVIL